ncbi:MAG TPA: type II toxin-antitoxin system HipA family toxin [Sphingomonas sp.]|jgi:serine/threonine-protein kinase HipA
MARRRAHVPLNVFLNNRLVGRLAKEASGAVEFAYDQSWLNWEHALPVSLSLQLRETRYTGAAVTAVFDNLLPDSAPIRTRVAERVGAEGTDAYSLLTRIGRDCVGALQFLPDGEAAEPAGALNGEALDEAAIEAILLDLARAPLGLHGNDAFRISIAGAQEKTALLRDGDRWLRPFGTTPTTHILKPQIGHIQTSAGTIDLSNSVENEFYCLKLMEAFGLEANRVEMASFGRVRALVVERFDRLRTRDGRLIRLPQEDCCQALSVPPTRKYQSEGGPGIVDIVRLLGASDLPGQDQLAFFKSQIIFWLIGATDGHAKNFSLALRPGGRFHLTPFYDVLTVQPSVDHGQVPHKAFRLAMSVGGNRKYRITDIHGRHFVEIGREAGLGPAVIRQALAEVRASAEQVSHRVTAALPRDFPEAVHASVQAAIESRLERLGTAEI